jgi:MFS family permease
MPDVTLKPLRSKANAVINLMGTAGGILVLVLGMFFATSAIENQLMSYTVYYGVIAGIMLVSLFIFILTVREKKWAREMEEDSVKYGIEGADGDNTVGAKKLSRGEMRSLIFILVSVALWYFGYNAVTSKYAVYATNILHKDYNTTMLLAQGAAIIAYIPAGIIASKIGRKKTILAGIIMLASAFFIGNFISPGVNGIVMYPVFILAGIGWATINVNSFPMVVELAKSGDVGKYTGYYYTASMSAQIAAPILSGFLYDINMRVFFFLFATVFVAASFVTMFFVKHGDSRPEKQGKLESLGADED